MSNFTDSRMLPWWGFPLRFASAFFVNAYVNTAYHIRAWGDLPRLNEPAIIISNHQIDLDLMPIISRIALHGGWKKPFFAASAKLLHEPGFLARRVPWLAPLFYNVNLGWLFDGIGFLPIENQLRTRSLGRWAFAVQRRHGALPLTKVFSPAIVERYALKDLWTSDVFSHRYFNVAHSAMVKVSDLLPPHRKEQFALTCAGVEFDLLRIEQYLRGGALFYITPEGEYSRNGAMLRFRGIWDRLAPNVQNVYVVGISYDPFIGRRLSQLYHVVRLRRKREVLYELQSARPITTSAMLCAWLRERELPFSERDAVDGVRQVFRTLPSGVFIDPQFVRSDDSMIREALGGMLRLGILTGNRRAMHCASERRHPLFAAVDDIIAFQARFFHETTQAAIRLAIDETPRELILS